MSTPTFNRRKRYAILAVAAVIGVGVAFYSAEVDFPYRHTKNWDFDSYQNGTLPDAFSYVESDQKSNWIVKSIVDAPSKPNVFAKLSSNDSDYHIQVMPDSPTISNGNVTVKIKIVSGETARTAGLLLRFIDDKHYFVLEADAMNNRLSLCMRTLDFLVCHYDKNIPVSLGIWHTLSASVSQQGIACYFDGNLLIRANDQNYQTGEVGFWTKKDTGAYFDDLHMDY